MNDSLKTLLIVGVLILILWNLGAGLCPEGDCVGGQFADHVTELSSDH